MALKVLERSLMLSLKRFERPPRRAVAVVSFKEGLLEAHYLRPRGVELVAELCVVALELAAPLAVRLHRVR